LTRAFAVQGINDAGAKAAAEDKKRLRMRRSGGGENGTLHIWAIPGAGGKGWRLRDGAAGSSGGDAGGGGVRGGPWVPGGAECATVLPAFAMEGCGGV